MSLIALLLLPSASDAMQRRSWLCQSITGAAIPACSITVYNAGTTTKATIYGDVAGSSALGNPITAGSDGTYTYYAANGRYTEVLSASGFTFGASQTQDFILNDPFVTASPAAATPSWINLTSNCTALLSPTAGSTWCFDSALRGLKVYDGAKYATITSVNLVSLNVKDYGGAKGDAVTDDTAAIQNTLNAACPNGSVVIPTGTYIVSASLTPPSYCTISGYGATLATKGGASDQVMIFNITGKTRIALLGLILDGNRTNRTAGGSPAAYPIYLANSSDVVIRDVLVQNSLWDGIQCAYTNSADATTRSNNITLDHVQVNNSSRNGLTVDGCYDVAVIRSRFTGSDTNNPKAGIDVEADNGTIFNDNIWFFGVDATNNSGDGLTFAQFTRNSGVIGGRYTGNVGWGISINTAGAPDNLGVSVWYPDLTSTANTAGAVRRLTANAAVYYFDTVTSTHRVNAGVAGSDYLLVPATAATNNTIVLRDPSAGIQIASATITSATLRFVGNASFTLNAPEIGSSSNKATYVSGTSGAQWLPSDASAVLGTLVNGWQFGSPTGGDPGLGQLNASAYLVHGTAIASMVLTNASGTRTNVPHMVQDTVTLIGGTAGVALAGAAAFTNATSYTCVCDNDSAVLACRVVQNGGNGFTVSSGAGTDVVRFICTGS